MLPLPLSALLKISLNLDLKLKYVLLPFTNVYWMTLKSMNLVSSFLSYIVTFYGEEYLKARIHRRKIVGTICFIICQKYNLQCDTEIQHNVQ